MTPSNATTVPDGARLDFLPRSFKEVLLLEEAEKDNREIPEMMKALSQAACNPESHFAIMTGEKYLTYLVKVQVSQDPVLVHSAGSARADVSAIAE